MKQLTLKGSAYEMGLLHGRTFKKEIHELAQIRKTLISNFLKKLTEDEILNLAHDQIEALKSYPDFYEEFKGISEGAEIDPALLMILNNYTDMRDFSPNEKDDKGDAGCSIFALKKNNQMITGQTWDMHASAAPYMLALEVQEPVKAHILTLTGCVALAGINEYGVAISINNLHCKETKIGLMWGALVRGMLLQKTAKDALNYLEQNLPCSGHNYLIVDVNEAYNVETTGTQFEVTKHLKNEGYLVHTNHYLGSLQPFEISERVSKTTHGRLTAIEKYFEKTSLSDWRKIKEEIFQTDFPEGICISKNESEHTSKTCGGAIFDLTEKQGELYGGNYADGNRLPIQW
ncbi:MAG: hypothetical protein CL678_03560 [Bdellovibrionaceae bacterium]|nr:hypothetical protein [Pseudobdellovibrionaceae bacterium]|tara:strand:- start:101 stop:1138 length:1038 start_codon:yes stop_codon:yes gene_type:complete